MNSKNSYNAQIAEEAAEWALKLDRGAFSVAETARFAAWVKASPLHIDELMFAASILGVLDKVETTALSLSKQDLAIADPSVVVPFPRSEAGRAVSKSKADQPGTRRWLAAAAAICIATLSLAFFAPRILRDPAPDFEMATSFGEQRRIVLSDASTIHLDTLSDVAVTYSDDRRTIDLRAGEAFFDVAPDPKRPFQVRVGGGLVEAVGTSFAVRHVDGRVRVQVAEGRVAIRSSDGMLDGISLDVGGQFDADSTFANPEWSDFDTDDVAAWRTGRLVFEGARLSQIVKEFNRYNELELVLQSPSLGDETFSGVFAANDPGSFVEFLEIIGDFEAERSRSRIVIRAAGRRL